MVNIDTLLDCKERVWFDIDSTDFTAFLQYAASQGCTWMDGSTIDASNNNCSYHMGINKDKQLGFVSMWCWFSNASNKPNIVNFKKIMEG